MRCFVGIGLSDSLVEHLTNVCEAIRSTDERWREEKWTAPANLHVTLAFFGSVPDSDVVMLEERLGRMLSSQRPCELPFRRLAAVPNTRSCSMVWAEFLDPSGVCTQIAAGAGAVGAEFGARAETRRFVPHVTLVRSRRAKSLDPRALETGALPSADGPPVMSVLSATLFSSTLTRHGPVHEALQTWPLSPRRGSAQDANS